VAEIPEFPIINSPEISPDGRWIAVDGWKHDENLQDARLLFVSPQTGDVRNLGIGAMPTWSRDGRWIAFSKYGPNGGVFITQFDGLDQRLIDSDGWSIQFSPDGLKAAYSVRGTMVVYDFIGDSKRALIPTNNVSYEFIYHNSTWSPDSKRICFKGKRRGGGEEFGIISAVDDAPVVRVRCSAEDYHPDIAWHPDGLRIAVPRKEKPGEHARLDEFNPDSDDPPVPVKGQPTDRHNGGLCWSRDGRTLYFVSYK
jgi:Tol biopolymer transport system component